MQKLHDILTALQPHADLIDGDLMEDFRRMLDTLQTSRAAILEEGRNLRIAVVGQMKAGKSSFLNAAFFGRDLLPKADTPMTAALTKIVHAPEARAEVFFYSREDWEDIEQRAREYAVQYETEKRRLMDERGGSPFGLPLAQPREPRKEEIDLRIAESLKASVELVNKARANHLDLDACLGKTERIEGIGDAARLAEALHDYVGSGGRFTAITERTVLHVNDPRLEGLEIIDTPGFNDPVVSRGQITRTFLGQCDVIFLLSTLSQFITAADMSVLREQLSEAGIDDKAVFLIGSQRDIALRQDPGIARTAQALSEKFPPEHRSAAKVKAMMQLLDTRMTDYADKTLRDQIGQPGMDDKTRHILSAVRRTKPCFISSWCWLIARDLAAMSANDRDQLDKLCRDTGHVFDAESLRQLSNIPAVRDLLLRQRERKDQLLAGKEQALLDGAIQGAGTRLTRIAGALRERGERIRQGNIANLERAERDTVQRLAAGRARLEDVFDRQLVSISQRFALLKTEVRDQARRYARVEAIEETRVESYEVSVARWFNPFSWFKKATRYRDVVTIHASAQDAMEQVEEFAQQSVRQLQQAILSCVDLDVFRRELARAAMALFDTGSADFDGDLMLAEVNRSMRRITIPKVDLLQRDYTREIARAFGSGRVDEHRIDGLREAQRIALASVIDDLSKEADRRMAEIERVLESTGKTFVADMSRDIQASLTQLRGDIANREKMLTRIAEATRAVDGLAAAL